MEDLSLAETFERIHAAGYNGIEAVVSEEEADDDEEQCSEGADSDGPNAAGAAAGGATARGSVRGHASLSAQSAGSAVRPS